MIKQKLKPCKTCGDPSYLWAHGNCKWCDGMLRAKKVAQKPYKHVTLAQTDTKVAKPFYAVPKVSPKQAKLNAIYNVAATQFKKDRPECEARLHGCQGLTHHVHHLYSGASRSKYYLDSTTWLAVCSHCHTTIHDVLSKEDAIAMGFKKIE